ncbi:MAG: flagellar basal body L-ring protein FlgH [Sporomusaceae bacterium]|nr:flagellar basal body L-ring protein FlgH [Sporomusaceae bacterium]
MQFWRYKHRVLLLTILWLFTASPLVFADSLWNDSAQSMFSDRRAHSIGDTLTIVISENSSAVRSGNASNSKSGSNTLNAGTGIFHFLASATASGSDSFSAKGALTNTNTVTGRVTVQVVGVKPNGYLMISGTQTINQNDEVQKITVTGTVRPDDIAYDNTILSSNVAEAKLKIEGNGPLAGKQRQGILTQVFNLLF